MYHRNYERHEIQICPVKGSQKFKDVKARLLFNLHEISTASRMVESVCNIVLL